MPFEGDVVTNLRLSPRDSIMTNAEKLASVGGGSTNCSAPLARLNSNKAAGDFAIYVSDNQSWVDARSNRGTATMLEWQKFRARNPGAKLACIDVQPNATVQARSSDDVLNVGGFSDAVFDALAAFARGELAGDGWVKKVERVSL
jgi:60 kDa SS-A/Ro ribonucleoprotein